jgi:hypothetical protein
LSKEYEKKGGEYENVAGSKNEPTPGTPQAKTSAKKDKETKRSKDHENNEQEEVVEKSDKENEVSAQKMKKTPAKVSVRNLVTTNREGANSFPADEETSAEEAEKGGCRGNEEKLQGCREEKSSRIRGGRGLEESGQVITCICFGNWCNPPFQARDLNSGLDQLSLNSNVPQNLTNYFLPACSINIPCTFPSPAKHAMAYSPGHASQSTKCNIAQTQSKSRYHE